jgi:hypothetical protein
MNRHVKFTLALITVASLVIAVGALAWRWLETGDPGAIFGAKPLRPVFLLGATAMLGAILLHGDRILSTYRSGVSDELPRFWNLTLVINFLVVLALQTWLAAVYMGAVRPDRDFVLRLASAFMGLAMAVRGNFFAKLPAPGEDADGAWSRAARRTGLTLVLLGLALTACAVALPIKGVVLALGLAFAIVVTLTRTQRRAAALL